MRLTQFCAFYKNYKHVPGHLYKGKHRIHPRVTTQMKINGMHDLLREQENISLLQNPYLTAEEDNNFIQTIRPDLVKGLLVENQTKKWIKDHHMESHFEYLHKLKAWE